MVEYDSYHCLENPATSHGYMDESPLVVTNEPGSPETKESLMKINLKNLNVPFEANKIIRIHPVKEYLDSKKEEDSKLRRFTIGTKVKTVANKTILLVGETGTGKSSLINAMLNHLLGTQFEENERCVVVDEGQNQSVSQTTAITVYQFFKLNNENFPYSLTIIDTPGFGDTRGVTEDQQIARILKSLFEAKDGVKQLDAVGLVLKSGTNRLSDRQGYVFDSVVSLFGKDLEKNIVPLITHSSGLNPSNELHALEVANFKMARDENKPLYFLFNNCLNEFTIDNVKEKRARKNAWDTSQDGMNDLLEFLKKVETQDVKQTADVLTQRIGLEGCCCNLKERIDFIEMKQKEIQQVKGAIEKLVNEANNATTIVEVDEVYKELESIGKSWDNKATRCKQCEENCHYPGCTWAACPSLCEIMRDNKCTSCAGKCHYSHHVKDEKSYVPKTRKVKKTVEDFEKKYEIGEEKGQKTALLAAIEKDLEHKQKERENLIDNIYQCILKLEDIALCSDSFSTYIPLDFVINKLKENSGDERLEKMIEVKNRMEQNKAAVCAYGTGMPFCYAYNPIGDKICQLDLVRNMQPK